MLLFWLYPSETVTSCLQWDERVHLDSYCVMLVDCTSMPQLGGGPQNVAGERKHILTSYLSLSSLEMVFNYPIISDFFL